MKALVAVLLAVSALAAHGVTLAGGGVDDPAGGQCIAHGDGTGCNPNAGKLFGRCVVLAGWAWTLTTCGTAHAVPAAVAKAGEDHPQPALAGCAETGMAGILATIRTLESGGNYQAVNRTPGATGRAAGAYQFVTDTWDGYQGYAYADQAPPSVQDAKAVEYVTEALGGTDDIGRVPVVWYVGHYPPRMGWDVVPAPGNTTTVRQYQAAWMATHDRVAAPC